MKTTTACLSLLLVSILIACKPPSLLDATVDAFVCPDGGICANTPDGGCDPQQWQTSCGFGLVCASDGTCGPPCGDGNTVCDPTTLCAIEGNGNEDCAPQCTAAGQTIYRGSSSCATRGLLVDATNGKCFVPCWIDECFVLGENFCGPPIDMSKRGDRKRVFDAIDRLATQDEGPYVAPAPVQLMTLPGEIVHDPGPYVNRP